MKAALIGTGKTGSKVQEALELEQNALFNTSRIPTVDALRAYDVAFVFVPGNAFLEMIPTLMSAQIAVVSGATGATIPDAVKTQILHGSRPWLIAQNFSPAMQMIQQALQWIGDHPEWLEESEFSLHEVHHQQKKDAPSGTAKLWVEWMTSRDVTVTSHREGDVLGNHELRISTPLERITLRHEALDRSLFAKGAIQAAHWLLKPDRAPGLYSMKDVFERE
jgi:4-hydroxy-tetrahydrodipicolinate reductase